MSEALPARGPSNRDRADQHHHLIKPTACSNGTGLLM